MTDAGTKAAARQAVFDVCGKDFGGQCDIVAAVPFHYNGVDWTVYTAAPEVPPYVQPRLALLVIGGALLLAGAVTTTGYQLIGRTLRPVRVMRTRLDEIEATDLSGRVPVPPGRDEIHDLAQCVNRTLGRLQAAMEQHHRFTSDASHELRTPIAAMRTQVEDAQLAPEETDVATVTGSLLPSLDRLEAIVTDLLTLARAEARPAARQPVDLAELVTVELGRRSPSKRVVCRLASGVVVTGNEIELSRVITNLLNNAERHAAHTITITVRAEPSRSDGPRFPDGAAVLELLDDGTGIPSDQHETVFQRFARLDSARRIDAGGSGLGLPIARQIAESHNGTLTIEDSETGACFVLRLPLRA